MLKPSATRRNRSGDSVHPWHKHFLEMKKSEAAPLIRMTNETKVKHAIVHLMNGTSNLR